MENESRNQYKTIASSLAKLESELRRNPLLPYSHYEFFMGLSLAEIRSLREWSTIKYSNFFADFQRKFGQRFVQRVLRLYRYHLYGVSSNGIRVKTEEDILNLTRYDLMDLGIKFSFKKANTYIEGFKNRTLQFIGMLRRHDIQLTLEQVDEAIEAHKKRYGDVNAR